MTCKCGQEIKNVPEHLQHLVGWVCRECSNAPPTTGLVSITSSGSIEVDADSANRKLTAGHAA